MSFDGEATVESPLGEFSGTAPGIILYESLPLGMTDDGEMWCRFQMPFAKVQFHVGGVKAGSVVDLYDPNVVPSPEVDLGEVTLSKGENTMTAEIVGANESAVESQRVGLDYVRLK
jgi:hypothetical protein